jgi:hypothetical protein
MGRRDLRKAGLPALFVLFMLLTCTLFGQSGGAIHGNVFDSRTGDPLVGAGLLLSP